MDGHPRTLFIQGAEVAATLVIAAPTEFFRYVVSSLPSHLPWINLTATDVAPRTYLTQHRYYSGAEAQQALSLPGPAPTHVVKLRLPVGTALLGPAWIEPLSSTRVFSAPSVHRYGAGIEYLTLEAAPIRPPEVRSDGSLR